jgi:hypothetical protein
MRVVFVVLDAFPNSLVDSTLTPTLARLARTGGRAEAGGVAQATAATYPNHATFATGLSTLDHGIMANNVLAGGKWLPAATVGPEGTTIFEACQAEGRSSALVVGDQNLVGVCGGAAADSHWPPYGKVPAGAARSEAGYIADAEVISAIGALDVASLDLLFVQLDEVDGVRHRHGAWGDEAVEQCHRTDAALGSLVELLRPGWDDTVMMVVSDHDQEDVGMVPAVDFSAELPTGVECFNQGTAALVVGPMGLDDLMQLPGVVGAVPLDDNHHVVWGGPGQVFGGGFSTGNGVGGDHGSPRTATQLAVIGGGHPEVGRLAARLEAERPPATIWTTWMAECLGLNWRPEPVSNREGIGAP